MHTTELLKFLKCSFHCELQVSRDDAHRVAGKLLQYRKNLGKQRPHDPDSKAEAVDKDVEEEHSSMNKGCDV